MKFQRRDFLKKSGILAAAGFLPGTLSSSSILRHRGSISQDNSFAITNAHIITMDATIGEVKGNILVENGVI